MVTLPLSEVIDSLRTELKTAIEKAPSDGTAFQVESAEVELSLQITESAGGNARLKFGVLGAGLELGGQASASNATIHKLRLSLKPERTTLVSQKRKNDPTGTSLTNDE